MGLYAALNLYLPPPALSGSGALRCYVYGFRVMFRDKYNVKLTTYNVQLLRWVCSQPVYMFEFANKAPLVDGANIVIMGK